MVYNIGHSNNKMVLEPNVSPNKQIIEDDDVKECKVLEPNVSPNKQIIKDDDVKECISIEEVENYKVSFFS